MEPVCYLRALSMVYCVWKMWTYLLFNKAVCPGSLGLLFKKPLSVDGVLKPSLGLQHTFTSYLGNWVERLTVDFSLGNPDRPSLSEREKPVLTQHPFVSWEVTEIWHDHQISPMSSTRTQWGHHSTLKIMFSHNSIQNIYRVKSPWKQGHNPMSIAHH